MAVYASSRLKSCCSRVHCNLVDHQDLQLLSMMIREVEYFLLNIYSDDWATAIQWLDAVPQVESKMDIHSWHNQ